MTKNKKIIIASVFSLLIVSGVVYYIINANKQIYELTQQYEIEKEELLDEYSQLAIQYEGYKLNVNNDSLLEKLENEQLKVQRLSEELKTVKATNAKRINELKKELGTVRMVLRSYIEQVDSLNRENEKLQQEKLEVTKKYNAVTASATALKTKNEQLSKQVTMASKLDAVAIIAEALTKREKKTDKINRAEKIKISFTISKNITADVGEKDIFIRIMKPDDDVLIKDRGNIFRYENSEINYSIKRTVEYEGEEMFVTAYWPIEEYLYPGDYRVDIFADGNLIGKKNITLQ